MDGFVWAKTEPEFASSAIDARMVKAVLVVNNWTRCRICNLLEPLNPPSRNLHIAARV